MDRNKNSYIFIYSIILVVVVAGALSLVAVLLQPKQAKNYEIEQKRNILSALKINVETKEVESTYAKIVTEIAVDDSGNEVEKEDALVLYKAQTDKGLKFVFPLSGKVSGVQYGVISLWTKTLTLSMAHTSTISRKLRDLVPKLLPNIFSRSFPERRFSMLKISLFR